MVAEARFTLRAVDETQMAFAQVQNNLRKLEQTANTAGKSLTKNLDLKDAARTLATVVGLSVDKIADKFSRWVTGQDEETQKLQESLVNLGEEGLRAQAALIAARSSEEQQVERLIQQRDRLRSSIAAPAKELEKQVSQQQKINMLFAVEAELITKQAALAKKKEADQESYMAALQAMESARAKAMGDEISDDEKLLSLRSKLGFLFRETQALDINDLESRAKMANKLAETYNSIAQVQERQRALGKEVGQTIAQGFEDAILAGNGLRDVVKGIAQDLLRLFVRQQITTPLASGIGSFFNGLMGRASGGPVSSGTPYMVGEKGPEIFVPRGSGTIIPNHALGGSGGGSAVAGTNVNVTYNIAAGVTKSELMPILETERKRLKAEIPDMVRRGGAYRGAFA